MSQASLGETLYQKTAHRVPNDDRMVEMRRYGGNVIDVVRDRGLPEVDAGTTALDRKSVV